MSDVREQTASDVEALQTLVAALRQQNEFLQRELKVTVQLQEAAEWHLSLQATVVQVLTEVKDCGLGIRHVLRVVCEGIGWPIGQVWLVDEDTSAMRCLYAWHSSNPQHEEFVEMSRTLVFPLGIGLPGEVWRKQSVQWVLDFDESIRADAAARAGLQSAVAVPLHLNGMVVGAMEFFSPHRCAAESSLLSILSMVGTQVALFLGHMHDEEALKQKLSELTAAHRLLQEDLEAASVVQHSLLPAAPPLVKGLQFAWTFEPTSKVAGDMFSVFPLSENQVGAYVLDVSGHGVPAALLAVSIGRALMNLVRSGQPSLEELAHELNRRFPLLRETNQFFTLLYATFDGRTREMRYVRCGHPRPLIVRGTSAFELPHNIGMPLGILEESELQVSVQTVLLEPGNQVYLYTDGLIEAINSAGEEFGWERLAATLTADSGGGVDRALSHLRQRVKSFVGTTTPRDDITIVGIGFQ